MPLRISCCRSSQATRKTRSINTWIVLNLAMGRQLYSVLKYFLSLVARSIYKYLVNWYYDSHILIYPYTLPTVTHFACFNLLFLIQRGPPVICSVGVLQASDPSCGVQKDCLQPAPFQIHVLGDHKPCSQAIYVFPKKNFHMHKAAT